MCTFYSAKFKKKFLPIMNSVEIPNEETKTSNSLTRITYIGGLTIGRDKSLVDFAKLAKQADAHLEINAYTPTVISKKMLKTYNKLGIKVHDPVYNEKYNFVVKESDVLLHIESANKSCYSYAMLSISTKIPEYLISGKAVLAYGPKSLASLALIADNDIGYVIDSNGSFEDQTKSLLNFLSSANSAMLRTHKAFDYAKNMFDIKSRSEYFNSEISKIIYNE